jgi:hypothetical protein
VEIVSNPRIPYELSDQLPPLHPLGDKRLLVHLVVNVEHWPFDAPMPRKLLGSPHGRDNVPDLPNFGWVEYGMRAGLPRILRALAARGLPASASMNASVIEAYPAASSLRPLTGLRRSAEPAPAAGSVPVSPRPSIRRTYSRRRESNTCTTG